MTALLAAELVEELETDPTERRPGDFARHPHTGAPYVAHPTETVKRDGLKADLLAEAKTLGVDVPAGVTVKALQELLPARPTRVQYGRPSGLGKQIENATNLQKWAERMVALGIAVDPLLADEARRLVDLDPESPEFRDIADRVAVEAKRSAGATLAAERGTHHHELTEDFDQERDPIVRMAAGENLGVPAAVQHALLDAWDQMLHTTGLEVLATEVTVVDDEWRQAGTLDRIARLSRSLRFTTGDGEIIDLPAGTVIVLDLKTGRLRLAGNGQPLYWHTYAVQVASYAQSVPYDPDTDQRGEWPWEIDQRWGIIAHLDVRAALDGEAVCQLIAVDLEAGRHAGGLCVAAKEWEKRCGVFGVVADARIVVPAPSAALPEYPPEPPINGECFNNFDQPTGRVILDDFRTWILARLDVVGRTPGAKRTMKELWPPDIPTFSSGHLHTEAELRRLSECLDAVDRAFELGFNNSPPDVVAEREQRIEKFVDALHGGTDNTPPTTPVDEGRRISDDDRTALKAELDRLPAEQRSVLESWAKEANTAGVSFSIKQKPSQRRQLIYRALIALAPLIDDDLERVRATVGMVLPEAAMPGVPLGHAIGVLTIAEAEQLGQLAHVIRLDEPALQYGLDGTVRWAHPNTTNQEADTNS